MLGLSRWMVVVCVVMGVACAGGSLQTSPQPTAAVPAPPAPVHDAASAPSSPPAPGVGTAVSPPAPAAALTFDLVGKTVRIGMSCTKLQELYPELEFPRVTRTPFGDEEASGYAEFECVDDNLTKVEVFFLTGPATAPLRASVEAFVGKLGEGKFLREDDGEGSYAKAWTPQPGATVTQTVAANPDFGNAEHTYVIEVAAP
jgi:hypothetical protein